MKWSIIHDQINAQFESVLFDIETFKSTEKNLDVSAREEVIKMI